jgi:hypothetical protein
MHKVLKLQAMVTREKKDNHMRCSIIVCCHPTIQA